jgi:Ferric iron reductase FhuF-like transporter.
VVTDPASGGWISAASLVDGAALPVLLNGPIERWGATPHAAAALAWKAYTYWLAAPAVIGFAAADRVPLLDADNVLVRLSYDRPFVTIGMRRPAVAVLPDDPYASEPGVTVVADRDGLLAALRSSLVDHHLALLAAATRARVRIGSRILAGALAASVGYVLRLAAPLTPHPPLDLGKPILDALNVADLVDLSEAPDGSVDVQRKTCCLAFTVPSLSICSTCCIKP